MKYERLTERNGGDVIINCKQCEYHEKLMICTDYSCIDSLKNRLAELEDKIERGELVENKVVTYINMARSDSKTLIDKAHITEKPDAYHLGFVLGPRINACGRVGKAFVSSRLLCSQNPLEAEQLAEELNSYNQERKAYRLLLLLQLVKRAQITTLRFVYL